MNPKAIRDIKRDIEASTCGNTGSPFWAAFWDYMWQAAPYLVVAGGIAILFSP